MVAFACVEGISLKPVALVVAPPHRGVVARALAAIPAPHPLPAGRKKHASEGKSFRRWVGGEGGAVRESGRASRPAGENVDGKPRAAISVSVCGVRKLRCACGSTSRGLAYLLNGAEGDFSQPDAPACT